MAHSIDPEPLKAFFEEVKELFNIEVRFLPNNTEYPIQLSDPETGQTKAKCLDLFQFIKGQTDLRDNEVGKIQGTKKPGRFVINVSNLAAKTLSDVYALSFFYPHEEDENKTDNKSTQSRESLKPKNKMHSPESGQAKHPKK